MTTIDITLLALLGGFILSGFWLGIIHMTGSIIGVIIGAVAAGRFTETAAPFIASWFGGNMNLARVVTFFGLFIIVTRLAGLAVSLFDKAFNKLAVIPFLKTFNRLLGAGFGLIEGTFVLGLGVYYAAKFPISEMFGLALKDSDAASALYKVGSLLAPLLPKAVQAVRSVI